MYREQIEALQHQDDRVVHPPSLFDLASEPVPALAPSPATLVAGSSAAATWTIPKQKHTPTPVVTVRFESCQKPSIEIYSISVEKKCSGGKVDQQ
jgi:hypothetical protein